MYKEPANEIVGITMVILEEFPELYGYLDETPLSLSYNEKGISMTEFKKYLETLKIQLVTFTKYRA